VCGQAPLGYSWRRRERGQYGTGPAPEGRLEYVKSLGIVDTLRTLISGPAGPVRTAIESFATPG